MSKETAKENARNAMKELFGSPVEEKAAEAGNPFVEVEVPAPEMPKEAPTVLGTGAVLTGSICVPGSLEIHGRINGDVTCEGDVFLYGKVIGNITCRNFRHYTGAIKGDVTAREGIRVESAGAVLGNLSCFSAVSDGKISGNITAQRNVELLSNAVLVGDVTTAYFSMRESACLKGNVKLTCDEAAATKAFDGCFDF